MKRLVGIGIVCLVLGSLIGLRQTSASDPEALRLLEKAAAAPMKQDYTAQATTFIRYGSDTVQTEAVVYNAREGRTRIEYRLGRLAGVIAGNDGKTAWSWDPRRSRLTAESCEKKTSEALGGDPNADPSLKMLRETCRASLIRHTTVAGRPTAEILLQPRGAGASRRLWIDRETGVILRSEERNAENDLTAGTTFHSIDYGKTASADGFLPIPPSGKPVRWMPGDDFADRTLDPQAVQREIGVPVMEPRYVPAGFTREGYYVYRCPDCEVKTAVTRYVNGLNSLTIVQAPEECEQHTDKRPLDFGLGKATPAKRGDSYFWVLGELSASELRRVSSSIGP